MTKFVQKYPKNSLHFFNPKNSPKKERKEERKKIQDPFHKKQCHVHNTFTKDFTVVELLSRY